jgi:thiamine pyrophosphate-dependent acetolactate synthase large subunit-like protein
MGFALPAAIGRQDGNARIVKRYSGDGGFQMTIKN